MIAIFDASSVIGAALKAESVPMRALLDARRRGLIALSGPVYAEIAEVLSRPKFATAISPVRREEILALITTDAVWFDGGEAVADCPDPDDNKYLELALWSGATVIVSSDKHLLAMHPWRTVMVLRPAEYIAWGRASLGASGSDG